MGTRALRKLREQEWERQLAASSAQEHAEKPESEDQHTDNGNDDSDGNDEPVSFSKPRNAFDMLNDANDDSDSDHEVEPPPDPESSEVASSRVPSQSIPTTGTSTPSKSKKKKKKKPKKKPTSTTPQDSHHDSEDEIDRALKELSTKTANTDLDHQQSPTSIWEQSATKLLAIEPRNLDPVNEMRGLFGNIALEDERRSQPQTQPRRRDQQVGVDLETALSGRYNRASRGKELGALAKRRNCLMQGKEHWPLATSGGLSMDCTTMEWKKLYNVLHSREYQNAQAVFRMAVESMQAEAMIGTLQTQPYNIASLLQVAEIAKHQGDSSLSGDLLQRALYTFGRSVHSSFPAALRDGTARLNFMKPSNRELYLSVWRYIRNLEQRGTWKTAFEWAKMLLQFDPESDPYGVTLMIDQLALRGRQHEQFLEMTQEDAYGRTWAHLPNICISRTLALMKAGKPKDARQQLALAIKRYPCILAALASALEVTPMPKSLWGKTPNTDGEKFHLELYVTRARDLWNTPETIGLISEVANTMQYYKSSIDNQSEPAPLQISLEEARHVVALEVPALIGLLPRQFTNMPTSSSDILPPPNSETTDLTRRAPAQGPGQSGPTMIQVGSGILQRFLDWFNSPADADGTAGPPQADLDEIRRQLGPQADGLSDDDLRIVIAGNLAHHFGDNITNDVDVDDIQQAFTSNMAGGWDYYEEAALHGQSDSEADSMPSLEDLHDPNSTIGAAIAGEVVETDVDESAHRHPHAATVEEAEDEDAPVRTIAPSTAGPVLDRIDQSVWQRQTASDAAIPQQSSAATQSTITDEDIESDPQRLQRWLISAGLEEIKSNPNISIYVKRLRMLTKNQQTWILSVIKQRGSGDLAARVESAL